MTITTDAAEVGWGAWMAVDSARGAFIENECKNSSNWRELTAVRWGLEALLERRRKDVGN